MRQLITTKYYRTGNPLPGKQQAPKKPKKRDTYRKEKVRGESKCAARLQRNIFFKRHKNPKTFVHIIELFFFISKTIIKSKFNALL